MLLGIVAAVFTPIPTGLLAGIILYKEKSYRGAGMVVTIASIVLFALTLVLVYYYPQAAL